MYNLKKTRAYMTVTLMQNSSLEVCAHTIGNTFKHTSALEHLTYTFFIEGVSRALFQELSRHRIASPSVKSTQYTFTELQEEDAFSSMDTLRASKYLVMTKNTLVNEMSIKALENLRVILQGNIEDDIAKYCLPQSYKTSLTWTTNARSLQNFIALRSSKSALWEIRNLANALFKSLPKEHKYFFENCIAEQE